ncbi:MAG: VIT1/CCC1 family protein [Aeropyrum sp.]|nr:VIT1/CCC1 family protein [Aeropyrum sp.]MCE4616294.1 VIT1/CCC1 family protein [Aeropyrum sp.]
MQGAVVEGDVRTRVREFCVDEYTDYMIYKYLASLEKSERNREILEEMSRQEYSHYEFWKTLLGEDCRVDIPKGKLLAIRFFRRLLGVTFTVKLLERHEKEVIESYKKFLEELEGEHRERLESIIEDELSHEKNLLERMEERIVRYLGFIALGLADAIIEITGVHAGFLGATATTLVAGVAGLIVGLSAAISMAAAAYLQAKHEGSESPLPSAIATGVAYFIAVIILAAPYFVTHSNILAFVASVILAVVLVVVFVFYSSVINESSFTREAMENLGILFGTAAAAYIFGDILGSIFGLEGVFG